LPAPRVQDIVQSNILSQPRNEDHRLDFVGNGSSFVTVLLDYIPALGNLPILQSIGLNRFFNDPTGIQRAKNLTHTDALGNALGMSTAVLATPLGIASAVFCHYYAPLERETVSASIELLAGIPSVVYGFWGLVVLVPIIGRIHPPGPSLLAGTLILTLMILPTIT